MCIFHSASHQDRMHSVDLDIESLYRLAMHRGWRSSLFVTTTALLMSDRFPENWNRGGDQTGPASPEGSPRVSNAVSRAVCTALFRPRQEVCRAVNENGNKRFETARLERMLAVIDCATGLDAPMKQVSVRSRASSPPWAPPGWVLAGAPAQHPDPDSIRVLTWHRASCP